MLRPPVSSTKHSESTERDEKKKEKRGEAEDHVQGPQGDGRGLKLEDRISLAFLLMVALFYALRTPKVSMHLPAIKLHIYECPYF